MPANGVSWPYSMLLRQRDANGTALIGAIRRGDPGCFAGDVGDVGGGGGDGGPGWLAGLGLLGWSVSVIACCWEKGEGRKEGGCHSVARAYGYVHMGEYIRMYVWTVWEGRSEVFEAFDLSVERRAEERRGKIGRGETQRQKAKALSVSACLGSAHPIADAAIPSIGARNAGGIHAIHSPRDAAADAVGRGRGGAGRRRWRGRGREMRPWYQVSARSISLGCGFRRWRRGGVEACGLYGGVAEEEMRRCGRRCSVMSLGMR